MSPIAPEKQHFLNLLAEDLMSWSTRGRNVERGASEPAQRIKRAPRQVHAPMDRMHAAPGGITTWCIECTCGSYVTLETTSYRDARREYTNHRSVAQERERKAGVR